MARRDIKETMQLVGLAATLAVALVAAGTMLTRVRLVELVTLFLGAFGAGASVAAYVRRRRDVKRAETRPAPPERQL